MLLNPPVPRGVVDDASQLECAPELSSVKERHLAQGYAPSPGTVLIPSLLHVGDRLNLGYRGRAIPAPELPMEPPETSATTALQFNIFLCPVFLPSPLTDSVSARILQ